MGFVNSSQLDELVIRIQSAYFNLITLIITTCYNQLTVASYEAVTIKECF